MAIYFGNETLLPSVSRSNDLIRRSGFVWNTLVARRSRIAEHCSLQLFGLSATILGAITRYPVTAVLKLQTASFALLGSDLHAGIDGSGVISSPNCDKTTAGSYIDTTKPRW